MTTRKAVARTVAPPSHRRPPPAPTPAAASADDAVDRLWRFLSSVRLALILILATAAAALAGALLIQVPAGVASAGDYAAWLDQVRPRYGALTNFFSALGLFNVFGSLWFRLLLGLLILNVIICTANRWQGLWHSIAHPRVRMHETFFRQAGSHAEWVIAGEAASVVGDRLRAELRRQRYRVLVERDDSATYLYADLNRFGKLGTLASHASIVLVLAAVVISSLWGFRDSGFVVPEGATRSIGFGTTLALKLEKFADEYYPEGPPKDYRSDVVLYDNGVEVRRATIRVNEPLEYKGIRFHQAFFGPAAAIEVKDSQGQLLLSDAVALQWQRQSDGRAVGTFVIPGTGQSAELAAPRSGEFDAEIPAGQIQLQLYKDAQAQTPSLVVNLKQGQWTRVGNLDIRFVQERQFTGLQIVYDPGAALIWVASVLFVLGMLSVFLFPHRRVWALCRETSNGTRVLLASPSKGAGLPDADWQRLTSDLRR